MSDPRHILPHPVLHPRLAERAREPRYSVPDAAAFIGRPPSTVRRWAIGNVREYQGERRRDDPLIQVDGATGAPRPLSFLNLLELRFLSSYRADVPLQSIRRALEWTAAALHQDRPLLTAEFRVKGRALFLQFAELGEDPYLINASDRGQLAWPESVERFMEAVDYDDEEHTAYRWWPLGRTRPVVITTVMNGGLPSTFESGVRTVAIAAFRHEGLAAEAIAKDVGASVAEVTAALEFHMMAA